MHNMLYNHFWSCYLLNGASVFKGLGFIIRGLGYEM